MFSLQNVKRLICETKTTNDSTNVWGDFTKHARSDRGAVLFAVVGGKLSEGLNFSDELGRCVIMVGLPYPNRNSVELVEKMKYLDEHSERDERSGQTPGQLFYEAACMKAVNQSIGRAIRHRKDYAAIVLLDERFARPRIQSQLPAWISSRLVVHEKLPSTLVAIRDFFKNHKNATL
uniref:ATP-dependent helicase C-terminal domain-containing protein n=1 Tax=Plectus sambesii TaxID=2011161 RepID=A0A914WEK4_9BILA